MLKSKEMLESIRIQIRNEVCKITGWYFKNKDLIIQAFTRSSYSVQHGGENNEILEFIGDKVLDYYTVKIIADRYGMIKTQRNFSFEGNCEYTFKTHERGFTELKNKIVCNKTLAQKIDEWGLAEYLIVGTSDFNSEVDKQEKVKADLFEAILGAVAVDCKWNGEFLESVVLKMLNIEDYLKNLDENKYRPDEFSLDNAINTLKELAEHGECSVPNYEISHIEKNSYDKKDNLCWVCTCSVRSWASFETVRASSKKMAKKCAAYLILGKHFELINEYGSNKQYTEWIFENNKFSLWD